MNGKGSRRTVAVERSDHPFLCAPSCRPISAGFARVAVRRPGRSRASHVGAAVQPDAAASNSEDKLGISQLVSRWNKQAVCSPSGLESHRMPGWGAPRPPEWQSEPAIQSWRLPLRYRITPVAVQALIPLAAASLFWVPVTGSWYLPAPLTWLLLAACGMVWQKLARRTWQESVMLTEGMLVVRNVFRTRRVPLADISAVWFRRGALVVAAATGAAESGGGRRSGRHAGCLLYTSDAADE